MARPRPPARCIHVQTGTRPHKAHGLCASCYVSRRQQAQDTAIAYASDETDFRACPVAYCRVCGRRIGGGPCPVCAPARAPGGDNRAPSAWAAGCVAADAPAVLRSDYTWAMVWCLAQGWVEWPAPQTGVTR